MTRFLLVIIASLLPIMGYAEIYKYTDPQGNVIFTDRPRPGAKTIDLEPAQVSTPPQAQATGQSAGAQTTTYESLSILSPQNDEPIRQNQGILIVQANLQPNLHDRDKLQLLMDGSPVGQPQTSQTFVLTYVDRGSHSLQLQVIDQIGAPLLSSDTITFHMLRFHI